MDPKTDYDRADPTSRDRPPVTPRRRRSSGDRPPENFPATKNFLGMKICWNMIVLPKRLRTMAEASLVR